LREEKRTVCEGHTIKISGILTLKAAEEIRSCFEKLINIGKEPIWLLIDSEGGEVKALSHVLEVITTSTVEVYGVVTGSAHSAAFEILQACSRRYAPPRATFMFHYPWADDDILGFGTLKDVDSKEFAEFLVGLAKKTGQQLSVLHAWALSERVFGVTEAKELGFIDEILEEVPV